MRARVADTEMRRFAGLAQRQLWLRSRYVPRQRRAKVSSAAVELRRWHRYGLCARLRLERQWKVTTLLAASAGGKRTTAEAAEGGRAKAGEEKKGKRK
jgi:hypothetical protein